MFLNKDLSVIAYANGFTLWQYYGKEDSLDVIETTGFFDRVKTLMAVGDIIVISAKDGAAIRAVTELSPSVKIGPLK